MCFGWTVDLSGLFVFYKWNNQKDNVGQVIGLVRKQGVAYPGKLSMKVPG